MKQNTFMRKEQKLLPDPSRTTKSTMYNVMIMTLAKCTSLATGKV